MRDIYLTGCTHITRQECYIDSQTQIRLIAPGSLGSPMINALILTMAKMSVRIPTVGAVPRLLVKARRRHGISRAWDQSNLPRVHLEQCFMGTEGGARNI